LTARAEAEEVSHMLFGDGTGLSGLFATHPPILERIRALEPGFRPEGLEQLKAQWLTRPPNGLEEDLRLGLATPAERGPLPALGEASPALEPGFRPEGREQLKAQWLTRPPNGLEEARRLGLATPAERGPLPALGADIDLTPPMVAAQVAEPDEKDYRRADAIV